MKSQWYGDATSVSNLNNYNDTSNSNSNDGKNLGSKIEAIENGAAIYF